MKKSTTKLLILSSFVSLLSSCNFIFTTTSSNEVVSSSSNSFVSSIREDYLSSISSSSSSSIKESSESSSVISSVSSSSVSSIPSSSVSSTNSSSSISDNTLPFEVKEIKSRYVRFKLNRNCSSLEAGYYIDGNPSLTLLPKKLPTFCK